MKNKLTKATFENVEERILYSADSVAAMDPAMAENNTDATAIEAQLEPETTSSEDNTNPANDDTFLEQQRQAVVFIDAHVEGHEALLDDLLTNGGDRHFEIHYLEGNGIDQISAILEDSSDIDAIHIIAHGSDRQIDIGDVSITADNIDQFNATFNAWSDSLSEEADILLYGCDIAATDAGKTMLQHMASATGADINASSDLTGHVDAGGDWELEYSTGAIETDIAVSEELQDQWSVLLNEVTYISNETVNKDFGLKNTGNLGQSFTFVSGNGSYDLNRIEVQLFKDTGAASQNITLYLRESWNGPDLASATISSDVLSNSYTWETFEFADVKLMSSASPQIMAMEKSRLVMTIQTASAMVN